MRSHEKTDFGGKQPLTAFRYALPCVDGGEWTFLVPASLVKCIGRYARIPEYARVSYLLTCLPIADATDANADAAQRP